MWAFAAVIFSRQSQAAPTPQGQVISKEGSVDFTRTRTNWIPAVVGQQLIVEDRLRTLALSRAMLQMAELGRLRVNELTTVEVLPPKTASEKPTLDLKAGAIYFFTRDKPREFNIRTPHAVAASRGTEFLITIEPDGRVVFTVFDGEIEVSNPLGTVILGNGEQGAAQAGQAPVKLAVIEARNIVQWWLYYPGILDPAELNFTPAEAQFLAPTIDLYRQGALVAALKSYPDGRTPQSESESIFLAALLLSVGQVNKAENQLTNSTAPIANALREMIATVSMKPFTATNSPALASEWLARSYSDQARYDLQAALASARAAANISTNFGFAWERIAELEFSFGRIDAANEALDRSLQLSPRNAQAWSLRGFLAAARNKKDQAMKAFQTAIELDPALGNAWLGLGLMHAHDGERTSARSYLQTAAAMEPNRSALRSYLAKGFENVRDATNAVKELRLAKSLDEMDPTPWLYSALLLRQQLRFNEAVEDLEKSVELNDNRQVYRSRLLLDQDRAVRQSSLASVYQRAGLTDVSVREAARAVTADYGNSSAHLFLAESFDALRDPARFNLRYESAWFNELLLANILAPAGAAALSQNVTAQEYSRLFDSDGFHFNSATEARSDKQFRQLASQSGKFGNTSYSLDLDYQYNEGVRENSELDRTEWFTTIKQQFTPQDSALLLIKYKDYQSGDNFQKYDPNAPGAIRPNYDLIEEQKPLLALAYHREWSPGIHTLFLGARLVNDQQETDTGVNQLILLTNAQGRVTSFTRLGINPVTGADNGGLDSFYQSKFETYSGELNQIFQGERNTLILGGRAQQGRFDTHNRLDNVQPDIYAPYLLPTDYSVESDFERLSTYGYYTIEPINQLYLTAGLTYDYIKYPINHREAPVSSKEETRDQLSPKAAAIWSPLPELTLRGAFARALGGVSFDETFRLEPTQLAGFNQSFRSIISESIFGSVSAPEYQAAGGALDLKFKTHTYVGIEGKQLKSDVRQEIGAFAYGGFVGNSPQMVPASLLQWLDYEESSVALSVNQLMGRSWSLGARYYWTDSELRTRLPDLPVTTVPGSQPLADFTEQATLHHINWFAMWNHHTGFFVRAETEFYHQQNEGYSPARPTEEFFQQHLFVGYRFKRQRGEIMIGGLNLNGADYRLNSLNVYNELPREPTFIARLVINL